MEKVKNMNAGKWIDRVLSPLTNQRGLIGDDVNVQEDNKGIGGTGFKTPEELATGYQNLMKKLGEQGNELGQVKKDYTGLQDQAGVLVSALKEQLDRDQRVVAAIERPVDYEAELSTVDKAIGDLDPQEDGYQKSLAQLVSKSNKLAAMAQHEKTLNAASEIMRKELSERDMRTAQQRFYDENPTFNTPEMQAQIKDYIAKDRTGMSDSFSAFREIQRDEIAIETKRLMDENAEYKKRLNLAEGTEKTGKVIVKGQSPGQPTKQIKLTGKDLDADMLDALKNA